MAVINPFDATVELRKKMFHELFYTDTMTIEREGEYTDPNTHITEQKRVVILEGKECRMSINGYPSISNLSTHKESNSSLKIFADPDVDLIEGDFVTLVRNGNSTGEKQTFRLLAGKPLIYDSHLEVVMNERLGV